MEHTQSHDDTQSHVSHGQKSSTQLKSSENHEPPRKYYENKERYHYSSHEVNAYRVQTKRRNRCTDTYIPFKECMQTLSFWTRAWDPKKGNCTEVTKIFENCMNHEAAYAQNKHILDAVYTAPAKAKEEGLSAKVTSEMRISC